MANISTSVGDWSTTAASNQPDSGDAATLQADLQAIQAAVRTFFDSATVCKSSQTNASGVGNAANTNEADLFTYTLPANALSANGMSVRMVSWGTFAATANTKNLRSYFGGTAYIPEGTGNGFNGKQFKTEMIVTRVDNTHVSVSVYHCVDDNDAFVLAQPNEVVSALSSNTMVIKVTGQSPVAGAASDVLAYGMKVWVVG